MDSRKSVGGESLQESLYSCTLIINVSLNFYKNLFGFSQNLLGRIFARMDSRILAEFLALLYLTLNNIQCQIRCNFVIKQLLLKVKELIKSVSKWSTVEF